MQQDQGTRDEVLSLRQFLQEMLLADQEEEAEPSLPAPGKSVIRNDRLLDLMGVSEASSSAGCSAYSLDDEQPAVTPLRTLSPHLNRPQQELHSSCLEPGPLTIEDWTDGEEELPSETHFLEDSPKQEVVFRKTRLSQSSAELLRRSTTFEPDFQTRMKQFLIKNQQKKERIRQSLAVEEEPAIIPMPRINQRSKSIPRNVSHLLAWNYEKESKLARMRDAETARQDATCVGKPSISPHSASLFAKRQDDVALCKVEDRLHLLGLIYQYQQEERKRADEKQASSGVQPRLAPHSANAQRKRRLSVHERLYQLSKRNSAMASNNEREHCSVNTAARQRRERNANSERLADAAQRLHALHKQYKEKQLLLSEEKQRHFDSLRTAPKMSARSRKLAAKKKKNPAAKTPLRCGCCGGKEDSEGKCGCTIEPRVNTKHAADIYERQLRWKNANTTRHSQQRQLQETLALAECTFRNPFNQKAWNTLDERSDVSGKPASTAFFKRCMLWAEKRDRQVAREKKAVQERQLEECTFKPRVTENTPKYLAARRKECNQQGEASNHLPSPSLQHLDTEELLTQLYSALDLQALTGEMTPEQFHSLGSDDEGVHGLVKHTFTHLASSPGGNRT